MVAKGNELRRVGFARSLLIRSGIFHSQRDNTIAELRSKITLLESTLARHLKSKAKTQVVAGQDNRSLINPLNWTSSDGSSPPHPAAPGAATTGTSQLPVVHLSACDNPFLTSRMLKTPEVSLDPVPLATVAPSGQIVQEPCSKSPGSHRTPHTSGEQATAPRPQIVSTPETILSATEERVENRFTKLSRKCSDEIEDFDPIFSSPGTPLEVTRKTKPVTPPLEVENRPTKRLVCILLTGCHSFTGPSDHNLEDLYAKSTRGEAGRRSRTKGKLLMTRNAGHSMCNTVIIGRGSNS